MAELTGSAPRLARWLPGVSPQSWGGELLAPALAALYFVLFFALANGAVNSTPRFSVFGVFWSVGFGVLVASLLYGVPWRAPSASMRLALAGWFNAGVLVSAVVLAGDARIPLLTALLFGVLYAALHLDRRRVRQVLYGTLGGYLLAVLWLASRDELSPAFEGLSVVALAVTLLAAFNLAREILTLREAAVVRQQELSQALARVEELAQRDELTGLYNRRHLLDHLERQLAAVDRGGHGFTLCYCDLDHFKQVNDRFGHGAGDDLLRAFAACARSTLRTQDLIARLGGEEFVLVLATADLDEASLIVERLRRRTATLAVHPSAPEYHVTLSVGIASQQVGDTVGDVIARADRALYLAKARGRDQLVISDFPASAAGIPA